MPENRDADLERISEEGEVGNEPTSCMSARRNKKPSHQNDMIKSFALVVGLIVLRAYLPELYQGYEVAMNTFFHLSNTALASASDLLGSQPGSISEAIDTIKFVPHPTQLPAYLVR